jgi:hypothetical protein
MINSKDFTEWKAHPVTKLVFQHLQERSNAVKEVLADSAGIDSLQDRFHSGYIAAVKDILLVQFDDVGETQ